ncbi:MAG: hypothetical protein ACI4TI_01250 [Christensenellales bacterium]
MQDKIVAFAGHGLEWYCSGVKKNLFQHLKNAYTKVIQFFMMVLMVHLIIFAHALF